MGRKLLILCFMLTMLVSCSSDSESGGGSLVTEINYRTVNYDGTEQNSVKKFYYDGNKITLMTFGMLYHRFTYTGDLITKISVDISVIPSPSSTTYECNYQYDSQNRLIKETRIVSANVTGIEDDLKVYTYNADGTVTRESYHNTEVNAADLYETVKIYLDDSNRFLKLEVFNGTGRAVKNQATYSNYASPFANITGYDKLYMLQDTKNGFGTLTNYTNTSTYSYVTNSLGYPMQRVEKYRSYNGGLFSTTTETYKY